MDVSAPPKCELKPLGRVLDLLGTAWGLTSDSEGADLLREATELLGLHQQWLALLRAQVDGLAAVCGLPEGEPIGDTLEMVKGYIVAVQEFEERARPPAFRSGETAEQEDAHGDGTDGAVVTGHAGG